MSAYQALTRLTGGYAPRGAYSLEFRRRPEDPLEIPQQSLGEHYFVIGPNRITETFAFRISVQATYGGVSIADAGNAPGTLRLAGEIHAYHQGEVRAAGSSLAGDSALGTAANIGAAALDSVLSFAGAANKSGFHDFLDLLWLIYESRDEDLFVSRKPESSSTSPVGRNRFGASRVFQRAAAFSPLDFEHIALIWNDYDLNRSLEVVLDPPDSAFQIAQSAETPLRWDWTLDLKVVRDLSGAKPTFRSLFPPIQNTVQNALVALDDISFTVQGIFSTAADVVGLVDDLRNLKQNLTQSLAAFREGVTDSMDDIRRSLSGGREQSAGLEDRLANLLLAGAEPDSLAQAVPDDVAAAATDPLLADLYAFERTVDLLATALLLEEKSAGGVQYRAVPPGARSYEDLALAFFDDLEVAADIRRLNPPTEDGELPRAGRVRIPARGSGEIGDNGILALPNRDGNLADIEDALFGSDLQLDDARDFLISADGDLATVRGLDCLVENLLDRLVKIRGTVPEHPAWGMTIVPGDLASEIIARAEPARTVENLLQDPAVREVTIESLTLAGDRLSLTLRVVPKGDWPSFRLVRSRTRT